MSSKLPPWTISGLFRICRVRRFGYLLGSSFLRQFPVWFRAVEYDNPQSVSQRTLSRSCVVAEMINVVGYCLLLQLPADDADDGDVALLSLATSSTALFDDDSEWLLHSGLLW